MLETDGGASNDPGNFVIQFIGVVQDVSMSDCGGTGFPTAGVTIMDPAFPELITSCVQNGCISTKIKNRMNSADKH